MSGRRHAAAGPRLELRAIAAECGEGDVSLITAHRRRRFSLLLFASPLGDLVMKVSRSPDADAVLRKEFEVLSTLPADTGFHVPRPLAIRVLADRTVIVTTAVEGRKLLLVPPSDAGDALAAAAAACDALGGRAREASVDPVEVQRLILAAGGLDGNRRLESGLDGLVRGAVRGFDRAGRRIVAQWTHNDFTGANVLARPGGVGVIDWALATQSGFAGLDRLMLAWHLWTKRDGVSPREAASRLAARDTTSAGRWMMPPAAQLGEADLRATALTLVAILGARGVAEQQPARLAAAIDAAAAIGTQ